MELIREEDKNSFIQRPKLSKNMQFGAAANINVLIADKSTDTYNVLISLSNVSY